MGALSRRGFLAGAAAGLAAPGALALGGSARRRVGQPEKGVAAGATAGGAAGKSAPKRTLRKAVMYGMIGEGETVVDRFKVLRDCGFEGVEMDSPSSISIGEMKEAMEKTGIKIHGLVDSAHWKHPLNHPSPEIRAKGQDALRKCLSDAEKVGAVSILLVPAVVNGEAPYDEAYRLSQEMIRDVLPQAKGSGVRIAIENVWNGFLLSPMEAGQYVDDFGDPAVAFHFDIGNVINFGWPDQWIRILAERIVKLHIKDFSREKRDKQGLWKGFDVELGEGDAGWAKVMAALDDVGYSTAPEGRWATAEVRGGDRARLKQVSEQMDRLFAM